MMKWYMSEDEFAEAKLDEMTLSKQRAYISKWKTAHKDYGKMALKRHLTPAQYEAEKSHARTSEDWETVVAKCLKDPAVMRV